MNSDPAYISGETTLERDVYPDSVPDVLRPGAGGGR